MAFNPLKTLGNVFGNPTGIGEHLLFGKKPPNPANAAQQYLNQIPGIGHQYYDPYINQGQRFGELAGGQYERMATQPQDFLNEVLANYSPSKGYQFKQDQALKAARNSAASGGFAGTENDQMGQAALVNSLLGADMQEFLNNILNIQGRGLGGLEAGTERGYGATNSLVDLLGNTLGSQAGLGYQGQQQQNINSMARKEGLFKFLSNLMGAM